MKLNNHLWMFCFLIIMCAVSVEAVAYGGNKFIINDSITFGRSTEYINSTNATGYPDVTNPKITYNLSNALPYINEIQFDTRSEAGSSVYSVVYYTYYDNSISASNTNLVNDLVWEYVSYINPNQTKKVQNLSIYCAGSSCSTLNVRNVYIPEVWFEDYVFNTSTYDLSNQTFQLNITDDLVYTSATALLSYNGTNYSASRVGDLTFRSNFMIPQANSAADNRSFYWIINITNATGTTQYTTSSKYQYVQAFSSSQFSICNSTNNITYLNITHKDETNQSTLLGFINSGTFVYYTNSVSNNLTYSYTDLTGATSHNFCYSMPSVNLNVIYLMQHSATNYPARTVYESVALNNLTTNKSYYLLDVYSGDDVSFLVLNAAEQALSGVNTNITKQISGNTVVIGSGTTSSDGSISYYIDKSATYTANFYLSPYPFYSVTQAFNTDDNYIIYLGGASSINATDTNKGITTSIKPTNTYLSNGTDANINFTITSSYWSLEIFGFNITNEDGVLLGSNSTTGTGGGTVSIVLPTGNNESFYMVYYWTINGTNTTAARGWVILDMSDTSYSIYRLISDFVSYTGTGFFGLSDFGIGIICFLIILGVAGTIRVKYGVADDAIIAGVIFSTVALLDVGFGLIPNPIGAVDNFPTIFVGIIFVGFIFKEVWR